MNFLHINFFFFFCFFVFVFKLLFIIFLIKKIFQLFLRNIFIIYFYFKTSNYDILYQLWYKFARNQKSGYLALRYRLVYLNQKFVQNEILNNKLFEENIQEYFILKRKSFTDNYSKQIRIRKFVPLYSLKRKFNSKIRRKSSLKGLFFFYLKDYEDRINNKEKQQKNLRIYEGKFGTYIYQELIKKEDQKQSKFIKIRLHRDDKINFFE